MYASQVGEQELTFAVSGKLWNRSLVMLDSETKTLWSHILGEAMVGPLKGQQLELLPSVITDWKSWQRDYPETTVLNMSRTADRFQVEFIKNPAQFVYGMADGDARAWPLDQLQQQPLVNDLFADEPVLILFDPATATARSFSRRVGERTLEFIHRDGALIDRQTRTQWHPTSGLAVTGPLKGESLTPALAIISYAKAWKTFHPDTTIWQAP